MKTSLTYILIGATISIAIFGGFMMDHPAGAHDWCVAETVNGAACPADPLASAVFHQNATQFFSTGIFSRSALLLLGLLFILIGTAYKKSRLILGSASFSFQGNINQRGVPSQIRLHKWLAFHELSPPSVFSGWQNG